MFLFNYFQHCVTVLSKCAHMQFEDVCSRGDISYLILFKKWCGYLYWVKCLRIPGVHS